MTEIQGANENRSLDEIRKDIDRVDHVIRTAFAERMALAAEIAEIKRVSGAPVYQPDREKQIIDKLTKDSAPEIKASYESLIREILRLSREYQERILDRT